MKLFISFIVFAGFTNVLSKSLETVELSQNGIQEDQFSGEVRFNPATHTVYHLFTRENPSASQPIVINNQQLLQFTNFKNSRRTVVLLHGWRGNVVSDFVTVLVPAFLAAEDVNVIVADWGVGANSISYTTAMENSIQTGLEVAKFINWLNEASGSLPEQYHIVGHGLGGHMAGIVGRNVNGRIAYITALDPSFLGWVNHNLRFNENDGQYTEVIHTSVGVNGYIANLGHADYYPNAGGGMPGCLSSACDHDRSFFYFAESIQSGGFRARLCSSYVTALLEACVMPSTARMGGLEPKSTRGVFSLETNAAPPFSR